MRTQLLIFAMTYNVFVSCLPFLFVSGLLDFNLVNKDFVDRSKHYYYTDVRNKENNNISNLTSIY